jgi:gluconolactonase
MGKIYRVRNMIRHFPKCFLIFLNLFVVLCNFKPEGIEEVIDPNSKPVKLHIDDIFNFTEGPVCDAKGVLYFTDGPEGKVYRMNEFNKFTAVITDAKRPDGMMIDREGNLVVCDYNAKRLDLYSADGEFLKTLTDSYNGRKLNGPNDVVIDRKGGIYFTDPSLSKENVTQDAESVYFIPKGGNIQRVADDFVAPNGIILTPDEKTLLVVDTKEPYIHSYKINNDGTLSNHKIWGKVTIPQTEPGKQPPRSGSVGVAMDVEGRLYVATDLGMEVFNKNGKSIGVIKFRDFKRPMNMTFDRKDPYTMIIASYKAIYSLKMKVKGISFPQFD